MSSDPRTSITAGTDGSSRGNPGAAGWAWAVSEDEWASGGWERETNNVAELTALRELLTAVPTTTGLEVRSDSTYVIDALVGRAGKRPWIAGWKRNAWRTAAGAPVANKDLMIAIDELLAARTAPTTITWVKAHKTSGGDPFNEMADRRAYAASTAVLEGREPDPGPGLRGAAPVERSPERAPEPVADLELELELDVRPAATRLWVERTGTRRCTGRSSRGAEVLVAPVEVDGAFTPGELLKIALAACASLSTDAVLARRLGGDYAATVEVSGDADREQERYPALAERLVVDLSGLNEAERARVETTVRRAVEASCTVGRTLQQGAVIDLAVDG